ncbi:uncharacterized protein LOC124142738 [Haliotis rufescens]|uniref:uncharacterized protein LOC124142738 n=1 Tax=Haliotis rufescens TaxID=6454 RepID=UPI00201ED761|nr:uncharacterized protein LOC124142738 [Haliotis rufescens]
MRHFNLQGTFCIVSKMVAIYIFLICLASALAKDPPTCCVPNSWQAYVLQTEKLNLDPQPFFEFFFDYTLKKEAQRFIKLAPGSAPVAGNRTVTDHNKGMRYLISPAGACTSFSYPIPMVSPCIPESATYLGESYVGLRNYGVAFNVWKFKEPITKANITIAVTQDSCTPILEGINGPNVNTSLLFNYFSSPVSDKSVFDVPSGC